MTVPSYHLLPSCCVGHTALPHDSTILPPVAIMLCRSYSITTWQYHLTTCCHHVVWVIQHYHMTVPSYHLLPSCCVGHTALPHDSTILPPVAIMLCRSYSITTWQYHLTTCCHHVVWVIQHYHMTVPSYHLLPSCCVGHTALPHDSTILPPVAIICVGHTALPHDSTILPPVAIVLSRSYSITTWQYHLTTCCHRVI